MELVKRIKNKTIWESRKFTKKIQFVYEMVFKGIMIYKPLIREKPERIIKVQSSAWKGLEQIIRDIIMKSHCGTERCLEFGVELGYSAVIFSNYFKEVIGVDLFTGDIHTGVHGDTYQKVQESLKSFENIRLIKSDYKDFIKGNNEKYDFVHVDIVHTYEATFECGLWSAQHSDCTIFHDTESFPEVKRAVLDIAKKTGKKFYNYPFCNGLGIVY